jgi:hypothetical protein
MVAVEGKADIASHGEMSANGPTADIKLGTSAEVRAG